MDDNAAFIFPGGKKRHPSNDVPFAYLKVKICFNSIYLEYITVKLAKFNSLYPMGFPKVFHTMYEKHFYLVESKPCVH